MALDSSAPTAPVQPSAPPGAEAPELPSPPGHEDAAYADPLLACLVFLTRYYQRPFSAAVLRAGLPLSGPNLTPALFVRGAARAGLVARVVRRSLEGLTNLELPLVAILGGDRACVIVERKDCTTFTAMFPEAGSGVKTVAVKDLAELHAGYVIFARPDYHFEPGHAERRSADPRGWFWGVLARNAELYGQVVIAAMLINVFALASPLFIMTVYDRVVPNAAIDTLWVLATGVAVVFGFDFVVKSLRGYFIDVAWRRADVVLASRIFDQVLDIEMAARPASAGGFANTLREFESVRDFITSASVAAIVDLPFLFLFIG